MTNKLYLKNCLWIGVGIDITPESLIYPKVAVLYEILKQSQSFKPANPPLHINLYDIDIPNENLKRVGNSLKSITDKTEPFYVKLTTVNYFNHGAIYIQCELNSELQQLQKEVVVTLVEYRGDCRTKDYWQPWREYNDSQLMNRDLYGNPYVLNTFTPPYHSWIYQR